MMGVNRRFVHRTSSLLGSHTSSCEHLGKPFMNGAISPSAVVRGSIGLLFNVPVDLRVDVPAFVEWQWDFNTLSTSLVIHETKAVSTCGGYLGHVLSSGKVLLACLGSW